MDLGTTKESALQITVKAVNDIAGPDGLVLTLLTSDAYPRISELNLPPPSTTQQATAIQRAIEVLKIGTIRQLNGVLNQQNSPSITTIHNPPSTQTYSYGVKAILDRAANGLASFSCLESTERPIGYSPPADLLDLGLWQ